MTSKTTSKASKVVSSKDGVNSVLSSKFGKVVGGSLDGEMSAFLDMARAMSKGALSVRGAQATIAKVEEEIGLLPSFRSSWCQDIVRVMELQAKEGGADATLKRLFNVAIQGRKYFNGKDGKAKFADVIEGTKSFNAIEIKVPSQAVQKSSRKAHHNEKAEKAEKVAKVATLTDILREAGKLLKAGEQVEDVKLLEVVAVAIAKELTRAKASQSMTKATKEIAVKLSAVA
jgi:hypothetical protein